MNLVPLDYQLELLRSGHHILPWIDFPSPDGTAFKAEYEKSIAQVAAWHLPLAIIGTQWEWTLADPSQRWRALPLDQSPLVWDVKTSAGTTKPTLKLLTPFGAVKPWTEVGHYWTASRGMNWLQAHYPDPPLILMISNNEAAKLRWYQAETDKHYVNLYGTSRDDEFKRRVFANGWLERYDALFEGMRDGLTSDRWKQNVRFAGYNAFGPDGLGRSSNWREWSITTENRLSWTWYVWDGAVPEAYDNIWQPDKTAFNVWSCQVEHMNLVFMRDEALKVNPNFWLEVIFWDGHFGPNTTTKNEQPKPDKYDRYKSLGVKYTPELYRGWVQYVMWTTTPRVAREWRASNDLPREEWWPQFSQLIRAVDLVYSDPLLTQFWRNGQLVANHAHQHPFDQDVPARWQNVDRWFALDTSADPPRPWKLTTQLPVLALARVIGEKPKREWLLYAHAPLGERESVEIAIPDYRAVKVRVAVGGSFYHVVETSGSVAEVGDISKIPEAPAHCVK